MRIGLIVFVFSITSLYGLWRQRQIKQGKRWASDRYNLLIMGSILAVGGLLVAMYHL